VVLGLAEKEEKERGKKEAAARGRRGGARVSGSADAE
jgi:hypothetical protein